MKIPHLRSWFHSSHGHTFGFSSSSLLDQAAAAGSGPVYHVALAVARGIPSDIPGTTGIATSTAGDDSPCMGT